MAHFLFPASASADKAKRKDDYPALLADIVRGATDSIDALILFRSLVTGHSNGSDTLGFMAFDAHVGETGCHLRAGMVNDLFTTYRCLLQSSPGAWQAVESWLDQTIARLEAVITQARAACVRLTKDKVKPSLLGFNQKQETPRKVLVQLGWSEPEQTFDFATKEERAVPVFDPLTSTSSSTTLQVDSTTDRSRTDWQILNSVILSRFVVYAYVLSKYKAFSFYNGSPNGSLQPQAADSFTRELMENSWDSGSANVKRSGMRRLENEFRDLQVWLSQLSCAWLQSLAKRSDLGCDMSRSVTIPKSLTLCLQQTAHTANRLISSTTQKSKLGLTAAACFPGYLLQREFLLCQSTPIILVDKHFCTNGYHINVFEATVAPTPKPRPSGFLGRAKSLFKCLLPNIRSSKKNNQPPVANSNSLESPLGLALRWRIKQTSIDALKAEGDPTTPHMVVTGNSLRGPHQQYTDLVRESLSAEPGSRPANSFPHNTSSNSEKPATASSSSSPCRCAENEAHVGEFLRADHDRIALSFFAVHCAYSFPLTGEEKDEVAFVDKAMDAWAEEKEQVHGDVASPAALWKASRDEADTLGTGTGSMHLFRWQHAFAESKGRLGWLLERSLNAAELMPLKAVMPGEDGDS
ncbi:hypothetical protein F5144DRAFT_556487 [Chaetomium tenue]|uniref:Uncharacterized protein n=1 Tax=Chaetomium tenue TaxID=1854479 RepID=A0ACB7PSH8_9PEZI|nr:hypothetical protein F5144DRAFT_556487 [Chaetomium globosum]